MSWAGPSQKTSTKTLINTIQLLLRIQFIVNDPILFEGPYDHINHMDNTHDKNHLIDAHEEHNLEDDDELLLFEDTN